jgi:hypothetical protein
MRVLREVISGKQHVHPIDHGTRLVHGRMGT